MSMMTVQEDMLMVLQYSNAFRHEDSYFKERGMGSLAGGCPRGLYLQDPAPRPQRT
jgi:hypothetical protein